MLGAHSMLQAEYRFEQDEKATHCNSKTHFVFPIITDRVGQTSSERIKLYADTRSIDASR